MDITKLSAIEIRDKVLSKELSCQEVIKAFIKQMEDKKEYNAVIEIFYDAIDAAATIDEKIKNGFSGELCGVPVIIKDNILYKGKKASCGSKMLKDYIAQYSSTAVEKLIKSGAIIIGRANMDEFAMGSSTENSAYGVTHNPLDYTRVAGGSSGGSAASVALDMCPIALGTETGGSVRQPASFCGIYGLKPTYGRISRYGVVAFASSLDQIGIFSKNINDNALVLKCIAGYDQHDLTSSKQEVEDYANFALNLQSTIKVGVPKEILDMCKGMDCEKNYLDFIEYVKAKGYSVKYVSIKDISLALSTYYILAPAEAASNLARFDGVKYTFRANDCSSIDEIYKKSRSEGFGKEVKRRIMLGNYVLSSGYYDAYYKKAKKVQSIITKECTNAFNECDLLVLPTTIGCAYEIGSKSNNPVDTYKEDIFTVTANITGLPSLSIPFGNCNGMPLGIQIMGKKFDEKLIYSFAKSLK